MRVTTAALLAALACAWFQVSYVAYADAARVRTLKRYVFSAIEDAVQQANAAQLTAFHLSKNQHGALAGLTHN